MSEIKTKIVNVRATIPIRNITPPLYGSHERITMTLSDILKCLCKRAVVHEVLPDGTLIRLTTKNFRNDHSRIVVKKVETKKEEPPVNGSTKAEEPKEVREPVSDSDGYDPAMMVDSSIVEQRIYSDGSIHSVIMGSDVVFSGEDEDEVDAMEPEELDAQMEERVYSDGIVRNVPVNACLIHKDYQSDCEECNKVNSTDKASFNDSVVKKNATKAKSTKSNKKISNKK